MLGLTPDPAVAVCHHVCTAKYGAGGGEAKAVLYELRPGDALLGEGGGGAFAGATEVKAGEEGGGCGGRNCDIEGV